jgi:hypothetical protein
MHSSRLSLVLCFVTLAATAISALGQQTSKESGPVSAKYSHAHELNGFLLRQDRKAIEAALGRPFHTDNVANGLNLCVYRLDGFKENYLVAFYVQDENSFFNGKVVQLELTGHEPSGSTGFYGLELGDSEEKVEAVLGKPTGVSHENDMNLDLWDYKSSNYSLEFTHAHKLYSIQVNDEPNGAESPDDGASEVYAFAKAVEAHDVNMMMRLASGEIECSRKDAYGIQGGRARTILNDKTSNISVCLAQAADAILSLGPEMKSTDTEIRVWEKGPPGMVVKFPKDSPLREAVLMDEEGSARIYEVTFK